MKILSFGSCNIDYVYGVPHFVRPGETLSSTSRSVFPGGKGLNQSIAIARSGTTVYHAGQIGADGIFLKELLEQSGVNTSYLKIGKIPTGHTIIQVDDRGENCIILCPGANHQIDQHYVDAVLSDFEAGDMVVLQNEISSLDYIVESAHAKGMKVVLNPSPFTDALRRLDLNHIEYLVLNEIEGKQFSGQTEPEDICRYFKTEYKNLKLMLTLGSRGCMYSDADCQLFCPTFRVDSVDTTAAGDTFTGYFIAGMEKGLEVSRILRLASAAAAIAVSRQGAAASIPTVEEVECVMPSLAINTSYDFEIERKRKLVETYIEANLTTACLEELSKILGYSKAYTVTWIRSYMKCSFSELVKAARCEKAAMLLRQTDRSVEQIIRAVGYENGDFFRRIFKNRYGKLPLEYRKFYRQKESVK